MGTKIGLTAACGLLAAGLASGCTPPDEAPSGAAPVPGVAVTLVPTAALGATGVDASPVGTANGPSGAVESFEACAAAGYPVLTSSPRQCRTPDGRTFVEDLDNGLEHREQIVLDSPLIADGTVVAGLVYDIHSGRLAVVVPPRAHGSVEPLS